jgi:hypothetical protein
VRCVVIACPLLGSRKARTPCREAVWGEHLRHPSTYRNSGMLIMDSLAVHVAGAIQGREAWYVPHAGKMPCIPEQQGIAGD